MRESVLGKITLDAYVIRIIQKACHPLLFLYDTFSYRISWNGFYRNSLFVHFCHRNFLPILLYDILYYWLKKFCNVLQKKYLTVTLISLKSL